MTQIQLAYLSTPLGKMVSVSDEDSLFLLQFSEVTKPLKQWRVLDKLPEGSTTVSQALEEQLSAYFQKKRTTFTIPLGFRGSDFQQAVWRTLLTIPYGETQSYQTQARLMGKATAYRAVANANGANPIAILIPCHRIIQSTGKLGGYSSGVDRKAWLLAHEGALYS